MKILARLLCAVLGACVWNPEVHDGSVRFPIGYRDMKDGAWSPIEGQFALRVEVEHRPEGWPVHVVGSLGYGSGGTEVDKRRVCFLLWCEETSLQLESSSVDASLGARRYVGWGQGYGFFGAGLGLVDGKVDRRVGFQAKTSDTATAFGGWLEVGVGVEVDAALAPTSFGVQARLFRGETVELHGRDARLDFDEVTAFISYTW